MNERLRILRKRLGMSQEAIGEKLGVTKTAVSKMELGTYQITDTMVKLLCSKFNVNEDWLRTGSGGEDNMFIPDDALKYIKMGKAARTPNEFREFLVQIMESLPDEYCDFLYEEFKRFAENQAKKKGNS